MNESELGRACWKYRIADKANAQFNVIKKLFADAGSIICASDARHEGEQIFRLIYMVAGCKKLKYGSSKAWIVV